MNLNARVPAGRQLVWAMHSAGVRAAFGVTGGAIGTVFDELGGSKIELFHCQHETSAAYAAMGRAIAARGHELPICFATAGPGMTNLLTGVAAAYAEAVPLLALTGNTSTRSLGRGALQDAHAGGIDAVRMFDSVTVGNACVTDPEQLVPTFRRLAAWSLHLRRPVHLNLPINVANFPLPAALHANGPGPSPSWPPLTSIERRAIAELLNAERPLIFAGCGVKYSGTTGRLLDVAQRHQLPIVVTSHGKGIPEDHPCFYGAVGFASEGDGQRFLSNYAPDAVLFLGTGLGEMATSGWTLPIPSSAFTIHVDVDRSKFNRAYGVTFAIRNNLEVVLDELALLAPRGGQLPRRLRLSGFVSRPALSDRFVHPEHVMRRLNSDVPEGTAIFAEPGNSMAWAFRHLRATREQELFVPLGLASMGSALGAALGAATAWRNRNVICVAGDCATLMHGNELKTAVEYGLPLCVLVMNDGGHGMVEHGSRMIGLSNTHVRFRAPVDFVAYARALGARGIAIRSSRQWAELNLGQVLDGAGPVVLDVAIDAAAVPPISDRAKVVGDSQEQPTQLKAWAR